MIGYESPAGGGGAPAAHATTHQDGGSDEINVAALSGQLADRQKVRVQDEGVDQGTVDTLDFVGAGVTAAVAAGKATVTIPGGGGSTPTGTGFRHVTAGVEDAAAKLVDTADINDNQVTPAKLDDGAGFSVLGKATTGAGDRADIVAADETVLGRTAVGNVAFAALATGQIANNAVTDTKLRDSAGFSVIGKATTGSGDPADIVAAADQALRRSGAGDLGFGTLVTNNIGDDQVTYAKIQNVSATDVLLGRDTAGAGDVEEIAVAAARTMLGVFSSVTIQTFTTPGAGTYTPTAGMKSCIVFSTGAGGGGGGADTGGGAGDVGCAAGGGAGGTAIEAFTAADIGASKSLSVGTGGTAGSATNGTAGGTGGSTTFGPLPFHTATGGNGGTGSGANATDSQVTAGGAPGVPTGGTLNITGGRGGPGHGGSADGTIDLNLLVGGFGGGSFWGGGAAPAAGANNALTTDINTAGGPGEAYGAGGGGAISANSTTGAAGGVGANGVIVVIEFI